MIVQRRRACLQPRRHATGGDSDKDWKKVISSIFFLFFPLVPSSLSIANKVIPTPIPLMLFSKMSADTTAFVAQHLRCVVKGVGSTRVRPVVVWHMHLFFFCDKRQELRVCEGRPGANNGQAGEAGCYLEPLVWGCCLCGRRRPYLLLDVKDINKKYG